MYQINPWKMLAGLLVCLPFLFCASAHSRDLAKADAALEDTREGFREQADFIRSEIKTISRDMEWLSLKIKDLEDFNRFVPKTMYDSLAFKKERIASYQKLLARYEKLGSIPPSPGSPSSGSPPGAQAPMGTTALEKQILKEIDAMGLSGWLELVFQDKTLVVENKLPVLFSSGSAEVPKGYESFIKGLARLIKPHKATVEVTGFADTDPIKTQQYPSNFELGAARAASVVRQFVRFGANPAIFKVVSTGPHSPGTASAAARKSLQRHADIVIRIFE